MRIFSGGALPAEPKAALTFLDEHQKAINLALQEIQNSFFSVTYAAPARPIEPMIRFADGTSWDPGSGRGLYQYVSGAWVKL